ncbi:MAG: pimeloyl-ACP methyl ester carboxylesterase [Flavobacteriaceae bacterium]|jgi:pimeloyl-ACP methyl ester carboxylesterase
MSRKRYIIFLVVCGFFFLLSPLESAFAETFVTENIESEVTWTLEGSPYILQTNINMWGEYTSLTIEPGVEVYVDAPPEDFDGYPYYGIITGGGATFTANGTKDLPILFASRNAQGGNLDQEYCDGYCWGGIRIGKDTTLSLSHLNIYHASTGLYLFFTNQYGQYKDIHISYGERGFLFYRSRGHLVRPVLSHVETGVEGLYNTSHTLIDELEATHVGTLLTTREAAHITMQNSVARHISKKGFRLGVYGNFTLINNAFHFDTSASIGSIGKDSNMKMGFNDFAFDSYDDSNIGIYIGTDPNSHLYNNRIQNANIAIYTRSGRYQRYERFTSDTLIENTVFSGNNRGIYATGNGRVTVENSIFENSRERDVFMEGNDPVVARGNYWGSETGPTHTNNPDGEGGVVEGDVDYSDWLTEKPEIKAGMQPFDKYGVEKKLTPVIFIPGITASYLIDGENGEEKWPRALKGVLLPDDNYLKELSLFNDGQNSVNDVKEGDIFREVVNKNITQDFIEDLESIGYIEGETFFPFPYDWRFDTRMTGELLKAKIDAVLLETEAEQVTLIAHSMGGLVAKSYAADYGKESIDKVVFVGTPHIGAPKAFKVLMWGDSMGFRVGPFKLNEKRIQEISQNFPSVYQLLPTGKYFEERGGEYVTDTTTVFADGSYDYDETRGYLQDQGRNSLMFDTIEPLHSSIENMDFGEVQTYTFAGCQSPTLGEFIIGNNSSKALIGDEDSFDYKILYINGDDVVPIESASHQEVDEIYYVNETSHAFMMNDTDVRKGILDILSGGTASESEFSSRVGACGDISGTVVSTHSPVNLHIYDSSGGHVGLLEDGTLEEGIEGVHVEMIEDVMYMFIDESVSGSLDIQIDAYDTGSYDLYIQKVHNGEYIETRLYNDVELVTSTSVTTFTLDTEDLSSIELSIDDENDGTIDTLISEVSVSTSVDVVSPVTHLSESGSSEKEITLITEDESEILRTWYRLDSGEWQIYEYPFLAQSSSTVSYFSIDIAGNTESMKSSNIEVQHTVSSGSSSRQKRIVVQEEEEAVKEKKEEETDEAIEEVMVEETTEESVQEILIEKELVKEKKEEENTEEDEVSIADVEKVEDIKEGDVPALLSASVSDATSENLWHRIRNFFKRVFHLFKRKS